jgi:uncharacterized membrane protein
VTSPGDPVSRPSIRWGMTLVWVVLVLSLAANAFFIGVTLRHGAFLRPRPPGAGDLVIGPGVFLGELSKETRRTVLKEMRAHRGDFSARVADSMAARKAVIAAMKADPFDPAAYRSALEKSAQVDDDSRQRAIDFFVSIVSKLQPDERKAVAERLEARLDRFGRWPRHRDHGPRLDGGPPPGGPGPEGPPPPGPPGPPPGGPIDQPPPPSP